MLNVSLIVPVKNEALHLNKFILEILNLKKIPNEIIFIDTGSLDKSVDIINENLKKFKLHNVNFTIFHLSNGYPGAARNLGIRNAKNHWVAFLDVGIHPSDSWLNQLCTDIITNDVSIVYGQCVFNSNDLLGKIVCALSYGVNQKMPVLPASIVNKKLFEDFGYFDEKLRACEDILWKNKLCELSIKYHESVKANVAYSVFPNTIISIVIKWFTYSKNESLVNLTPVLRKFVYCYIFILLLLFFVNYKFSICLLLIYLVVRGFFDPLRRSKYKKWWSSWFQFSIAPFIALLMDISSLLGFITGKWKKFIN